MEMKRKALMAIVAVSWSCCVVSTAFATQWYDFTLSGSDIMTASLYVYVGTTELDSPREADIFDTARRFIPVSDPDADLRTYRSFDSTVDFLTWYSQTSDRLTSFNLWGLGGDDAWGFGEEFIADAWGTGTSTSSDWGSFTDETIYWGTADYDAGLIIGDSSNPDFYFSLGLPDDFSDWYDGVEGQLVFWFGGTMSDENYDPTGILQGNIILTGTPVPEPATMFLFGVGLAGLAGLGKRKGNKQQ